MTEPQIPYMDEFKEYLQTVDGLADRTIRRHVENAEGFIYYMSTHGYEADYNCKEEELPMDDDLLRRGMEFMGMYFSYFLPRKACVSADELRQSSGSIKKLYRFLAYKGIVSEEMCAEIIDEIKESVQYWMEECG